MGVATNINMTFKTSILGFTLDLYSCVISVSTSFYTDESAVIAHVTLKAEPGWFTVTLRLRSNKETSENQIIVLVAHSYLMLKHVKYDSFSFSH